MNMICVLSMFLSLKMKNQESSIVSLKEGFGFLFSFLGELVF